MTIDELLFAIVRGQLERSSFKNGCLCSGLGCQLKSSQPRRAESLRTIHAILHAYLAGEPQEDVVKAHREAAGFVERSYEWLGAVSQLSEVQRKMFDRMFLILDYFAKHSVTAAGVQTLSDCHHNTFRYIEGWIHGIGTGRLGIPTRRAQAENQRLGHMLFGYALGLDRWLTRVPMQFLLSDLGQGFLEFLLAAAFGCVLVFQDQRHRKAHDELATVD